MHNYIDTLSDFTHNIKYQNQYWNADIIDILNAKNSHTACIHSTFHFRILNNYLFELKDSTV